jgi:UDP:flavonoid glycosyltransferase YjiC (YdhE family)
MKGLFVPFAPSLAHVSRCLAVAEACRARGHTAVFAVGPERVPMVQEAGFEVHPVPEVSGAVFRTDRGFRWLTAGYFSQNLDAEHAILADVEPDVVVLDFRFTTAVAARLYGLPTASILHGNALRLARQPRDTARLLIGEPRDTRGRILRSVFPLAFQAMMRVAARRYAPVLKARGLPPVRSPFELLLADTLLLADIPALLPPELPPNSHIIGPLEWMGWDQAAPWLDELDACPLIYVTMGSTVEAQAVLVKLIEALRHTPYNVVLTTGSLSLPPELELPPHIHAFSTVPGATVLRRSALIVHHGGHGTLLQALAAGVPSLMMPSNPDQILVAQQAQAQGIGRNLWRPGALPVGTSILNSMSPLQIRREIDDLLADQAYAQACQTLQREITTYRGGAAAVDIMERIASAACRQGA